MRLRSIASLVPNFYPRLDDMPYRLDPQVAGELGEGTVLNSRVHPPVVSRVDYVLDSPTSDEFIQSFPVYLIGEELGARLELAGFTGFTLADAIVRPSANYLAICGKMQPPRFRWMQVSGIAGISDCWIDDSFQIYVSDQMMYLMGVASMSDCLIEKIPE